MSSCFYTNSLAHILSPNSCFAMFLFIYSQGFISQVCSKLNPSDLQVKQQEFAFTLSLFSADHDPRFSSWV